MGLQKCTSKLRNSLVPLSVTGHIFGTAAKEVEQAADSGAS